MQRWKSGETQGWRGWHCVQTRGPSLQSSECVREHDLSPHKASHVPVTDGRNWPRWSGRIHPWRGCTLEFLSQEVRSCWTFCAGQNRIPWQFPGWHGGWTRPGCEWRSKLPWEGDDEGQTRSATEQWEKGGRSWMTRNETAHFILQVCQHILGGSKTLVFLYFSLTANECNRTDTSPKGR